MLHRVILRRAKHVNKHASPVINFRLPRKRYLIQIHFPSQRTMFVTTINVALPGTDSAGTQFVIF